MKRRRFRLPALFFVATLATGCGSTRELSAEEQRVQERATQVAVSMVGKPYHYGGNSPTKGFDCSGLIQYSYSRAGVRLPHGTSYLRRNSRPISRSELRRGDLLFFDQEGKSSSHVAMYIGNNRFVSAPSTGKHVYIAEFSNYWNKHFNEARRLDLD